MTKQITVQEFKRMQARKNVTRIMGIDPGPEFSAAVLWNPIINKITFKTERCPMTDKKNKWKNERLLNKLYFEDIAIEMVDCFGMPVGKDIFSTVLWVGRFWQKAESNNVNLHLVYRKQVKINLCHSVRAKDSNIRQALIDRFGLPGTKKNPGLTYGLAADLWQAFAVAVTFWDLLQEESNERRNENRNKNRNKPLHHV